jgi:cation diffusion facilitator family transporter
LATIASQEKQSAAISSAFAALGLTGLKIVVGLITNSLGILAEAAHSGLDLVAAMITAFAVKESGKPADREHPYGHGKVENVSAFVETLLLLVTCAWIIWTAVTRVISKKVEIEVNEWSFIVMLISIIVDFSRSRMLFRVANKFKSQALEADALHFSTDIWSSAVVIFGLLCVKIGEWVPQWRSLHYADAFAAVIVALIVIRISAKLGMRTVNALLDTAPAGLQEKIKTTVEAIPNILNCHNIRIRAIGHQCFIDLHILVNGDLPLKKVHGLTDTIEQAIQKFLPEADVTVHPEPK